MYFLLQHRKGHGQSKGLSSLLVGTMDSIFDTKPAPYRILHQTPSSEVYYGKYLNCIYMYMHIIVYKLSLILVVACSMTKQEILADWEWLFNNVSDTLYSFDSEEDITDFVMCKIESVIATRLDKNDAEGKLLILNYFIKRQQQIFFVCFFFSEL